MTSWNIHPSLVGQGGMKVDTFHRYVALFNSFSQTFFLDGLEILLRELKLDIAIQDLRAQLDDLGIRTGAPLIQALIDKINTDRAAAAQAPAPAAALAPPPMPPNH